MQDRKDALFRRHGSGLRMLRGCVNSTLVVRVVKMQLGWDDTINRNGHVRVPAGVDEVVPADEDPVVVAAEVDNGVIA